MSAASEIAAVGFGVALLAHGTFAAVTALRERRNVSPSRAWLLAAVMASALWAAAQWAGMSGGSPSWQVVATWADLGRYGCWYAFLWTLLHPSSEVPSPLPGRWLKPVLATILLMALAAGGAPQATLDAAGLQRLPFALNLAVSVAGLLLVEQLFRNSGEGSRWHVKPVCIGLALVFAYDTYLYSEALLFGNRDADGFHIRGAIHTLGLLFLVAASRRNRNWTSRLQLSRAAAFYSASLVLAGGYLLFMSALGYYVRFFGGDWGRALQLGLFAAAMAFGGVLAFSSAARSRLRVFLGKHFFRYRYDYREEWLHFTSLLAARRTPQDMGADIVRGMARLVECPGGSLWGRTADGAAFVQMAAWNAPSIGDGEPGDSSLSRFLGGAGWVIDLDEFRASPRRYGDLALPNWLLGLKNGWLVIPLLAGDELQGFVVLARPLTPIKLNWEVLDLLKTVGRQAAAYLAQMQAAEALLEARKFDAFNRMSAFVVHDLKNIVAQLSLMLKNAQRLADNPEFRQDMLLTVESSLEKMRRLMLQLREGATPPGGSRGVELQPIVQRLCALARGQGRELRADTVEPVATRGHEERLERVLGHFVQNALDATPPEGHVWIEARRVSGQIKVEVGDTGAGMTEEFVRTRLFKPFSSTKVNGMGIGSYESHQYIRELGGDVQVHSAPGEGTRIEVTLPVFEAARGSDLMAGEAGRR